MEALPSLFDETAGNFRSDPAENVEEHQGYRSTACGDGLPGMRDADSWRPGSGRSGCQSAAYGGAAGGTVEELSEQGRDCSIRGPVFDKSGPFCEVYQLLSRAKHEAG